MAGHRREEYRPVNFTGPKVKKSRALGVALTPKAQKYLRNRPYAPGQHGQNRRRRRSEYGTQLLEKQRLRFQYNVSEKYLQGAYTKVVKRKGPTGDLLLQYLEGRLDALVLRSGLAPSIFAARQFVTHGHFRVNGRKASIPSMQLRPGDLITIREKSKQLGMFNDLRQEVQPAPYIALEENGMAARFSYVPPREEIPVVCDEQLIVEYYNR